jgi:LPS-assembly lipoprotein
MKPGVRRRQLLTLAAACAVSSCGFQPVYMPTATGAPGAAQRELAAVHVALIPDRPGQLLRQALQNRLEMSGSGEALRYDLAVVFWVAAEGIAIQSDNTATRIRATGNANWILVAQDPGRSRLTSGFARTIDALNIMDEQYFAADMENEAMQKRIAEALADQIAMQLAIYFRKRAAATG